MNKKPFKNLLSIKKMSRSQVEKYFRDYVPVDTPNNVISAILEQDFEDARNFVNIAARIEFLMHWHNIMLNG